MEGNGSCTFFFIFNLISYLSDTLTSQPGLWGQVSEFLGSPSKDGTKNSRLKLLLYPGYNLAWEPS